MSSDDEHGLSIASMNLGKTDADRAAEMRDRMYSALAVVCEIMDEAKKAKIRVGFSLSPADAFGRHHVALLEILKEL